MRSLDVFCVLFIGLTLFCIGEGACGIVQVNRPARIINKFNDATSSGCKDVQLYIVSFMDSGPTISLSGDSNTNLTIFVNLSSDFALPRFLISNFQRFSIQMLDGRAWPVTSSSVGTVELIGHVFVRVQDPMLFNAVDYLTVTRCKFISCPVTTGGSTLNFKELRFREFVTSRGNFGLSIAANFFSIEDSSFDSGEIALNVKGNLVVRNSQFFNLTAPQSTGWIINSGSNLTVFNSTFYNNRAGCISSPNLTLSSSNFTGNTRPTLPAVDGGVISAGTGRISSSTFFNNTSPFSVEGGVIFFNFSSTVDDCKFVSNSGKGAIKCGSRLRVTNSTFTDNRANGFVGGAIYYPLQVKKSDDGPLEVINSTFNSNYAQLEGGAIWSGNDALILTSCNFTGNRANYGGSLRILKSATLTSCNFDRNNAYSGGAISSLQTFSISQCKFTRNRANSSGAIQSGKNVTISDSEFSFNAAVELSGGAISINETLILNNVKFIGNNATSGNGGAVYAGSVLDVGSEFTNNQAYSGGGIYVEVSTVLEGTEFNSNYAKKDGGGLYSAGSLSCTDCSFQYNRNDMTNSVGDAIYARDSIHLYGSYLGGFNHPAGPSYPTSFSIVSEADINIYNPKSVSLRCDTLKAQRVVDAINGKPFEYHNLPLVSGPDQKQNQREEDNPIVIVVRGMINSDWKPSNLRIGEVDCTDYTVVPGTYSNSFVVSCNVTRGLGSNLEVKMDEVCFNPEMFVNYEKVDPLTQIRASINRIANYSSESVISTRLYEAISDYFGSNSSAINPLVVSNSDISVSAFDTSRNGGESIGLSLDLYNTSASFPTIVLSELLKESEEDNAILVLTTFERGQNGFSQLEVKGSIVYGLTLIGEDGGIITVENTVAPISISIALYSNLTQQELDSLDCLWWDEASSQWKNEGCSKKNVTNLSIQCECNHLTNFSAGVIPKAIRSDSPIVSPNSSSRNVGLIVGVVIGGIFLVVVVVIIVLIILLRKKRVTSTEIELEPAEDVTVGEIIGKGAYSIVYKGIVGGTTTVAVKKLNAKEDPKDFVRESDILRGSRHPNIIQFLRKFEDEKGLLCMILEYMPHGDLLNYLQTNQTSDEFKIKVMSDIAAALRYLRCQIIGQVVCSMGSEGSREQVSGSCTVSK
eukprot:TRINITY_DN3990_c0_g1_i2.p1 TRINITY_DN3990_c0_g1~~TRINITY_DN3990_c0_g1_i2.p1  ORF type:complete len:1164 (-),score=291.02 TRINITY_DN3990_c0_g1_i2:50-3487(-)